MSTTRVITNAIVITTAIDGDPAVSYIIETSRDGVRIGTNESSAKWRGVIRFLEKEGGDAPVSRAFYAGVALRATDGTYSWTMPPTASPISSIGTTDSPYSITVNKSHSAIVIAIWEERPSNEDINDYSCLSYYTAKKELMVVADGQNAIRLSLDNEHEDFLYDGGSLVAPSGGASSAIHLYDGGVEKTSDATLEVYSVSGTTADTSGAYIDNRVLYVKSINAASASVMVRALYEGTYYYAEFTANRVTQDKYDIILSPSSIAYNSATYQTQRVMVSAKGIGIGGTPITARISSMPHSGHLRAFWAYVSDNGSVGSMSRLSGDAVYKNVTASECANYAGIYFELRWYDNELTSDTATSGYRVCDFETVEIAKAENGANAANAYATPEVITIPCNEDGSVAGIIEKNISFSMKVGSYTANVSEVTSGTCPTGVTTEAVSASAMKITVSTSATAAGMAGGVTFTVIGSYDGKSYSVPVTVGLIGALKGRQGEGQKGKSGRFYYYAGEFDRNNTTAAFLVSDTQAPYFKNIENYYLFDYDANGYYTMHDMYDIQHSFEEEPWVPMWNEFKYLITEAIFGNYAHFGSFIINRDWMLSQYGILVDNNGNKTTINASNVNTPFSANGALILNGNGVNNGIIVCKLSFTLSASTTVTATITPNSEDGCDFGAVGKVDNYALGGATAHDIRDNSIPLLVKASGTTSATATTTVSAGSHYFYVAYAKDVSLTKGTDQATINLSFASGTVYYNLSVIKITEGMNYSGGSRISIPYGWFDATDPMADTLPSSGYKFVPNYAVDGLTGATYQNDAYVSGEIHAGSGSIGGFSIGTDDLTNTNYDAGITIRDVYNRKSVQIGADAEDTMTGRKAAMVAKATEYNTSDNDSPYNTALYLEARYATYNYAFHGYGNGVLDGYMQGFKVYSFTATSAENAVQMKLGNGMIQAIRSVTVAFAKVYLPKLGEIKETLGITGTRDFCCELIIINQSIIGTSNTVKIEGDDAAYTRTTTDKDAKPVILRGESSKYLDLEDRFNAHFFITYISQRFIANYISG